MGQGQSTAMARRAFLANVVRVGGAGLLAPLVGPGIMTARACPPFDPQFALDVPLPLSFAAYAIENSLHVKLPPGYDWTAKVVVNVDDAAVLRAQNPKLAKIAKVAIDQRVFGLMGRNISTRTAFLAFRGTVDYDDVITDLGMMPTPYHPVDGFGWVHSGFLFMYGLLRRSIVEYLPVACTGCDKLLITGHSLGAALAVLAAPDVMKNVVPNLVPSLITFAGPAAGLWDFATAFNGAIDNCYRVVNAYDLVPYMPPPPYEHVGVPVAVDSGGSVDPFWRHSLYAYQVGLERMIKSPRR
ncbi:class 3 lipase [Mycobacterium haemophilum DSM 44634]|uniref:lipase family protein n=1 Tax=Mycobacterium haemophilum TaxID=29311 RepID=UPI0006D5C793|nr:lipase family protein [Mycobacterium haemophilum]